MTARARFLLRRLLDFQRPTLQQLKVGAPGLNVGDAGSDLMGVSANDVEPKRTLPVGLL